MQRRICFPTPCNVEVLKGNSLTEMFLDTPDPISFNSTMKHILTFLLLTGIPSVLLCQNKFDARGAVILEATIQEAPPQIQLTWVKDTVNLGYTIYRKFRDDQVWSDTLAILDPTSTTWTDTSISIGTAYEYYVLKSMPKFPENEGPVPGTGYIYAGLKVPATHFRGGCLVVIDSSIVKAIQPKVDRLLEDLEADGWDPSAILIDRNDPVTKVKAAIKTWAANGTPDPQAVLLLGHVPVPYSGDIAPDGHNPDHKGAWPADGYYGNLDGIWTDSIININNPVGQRNDNYPGDGKFDNRFFPTIVQLQVGRVDLWGMTKFPESEEDLLRRYLDKDHAWRIGQIPVVERGLIDNNFSQSAEGICQAGWKNFAPLFGIKNVHDVPYRTSLQNASYLWSFGAGGGGPESASDISNTTNYATDSLQTQFTFLFGSYFGDWDAPNNFLRAPLASRSGLTCTWGTRPNWQVHHMALGEPIGFSTRVTMNNVLLYKGGSSSKFVHIALMGDPTLRVHVLPPVVNLTILQDGKQVHLNWDDPTGAIGYHIYKKSASDQPYTLLNVDPISDPYFVDTCVHEGWVRYMVRSVELRTSGSGSYYNLSNGISDEVIVQPWDLHPQATPSSPGNSDGSASVNPVDGCLPHTFQWSDGSTTAAISGLQPGTYCVTVTDCLGCSETACVDITMNSGLATIPDLISSHLFPNPTADQLTVDLVFGENRTVQLRLLSMQGQILKETILEGRTIHHQWDVHDWPSGVYWIQIESEGYQTSSIWVKN